MKATTKITPMERRYLESAMAKEFGVKVSIMNNSFRIDYNQIVLRIYKKKMSVEVIKPSGQEWDIYDDHHDAWRWRDPEDIGIDTEDWKYLRPAFERLFNTISESKGE